MWYFTGGLVLFFFLLQVVSGMLLSFYYVPHVEQAHKSIIEIVTKLNMGWFFRSFHHWGAQLSILTLLVHLFSVLLLKAYRKPRELLWYSGFLLLILFFFFGLSGYLLLWNERSFAAVRVATGGLGAIPLVGNFLKAFLRGGVDVTQDTLVRFYAFHVVVLPIITLLLTAFHLLLVQFHGPSIPLSQEGKKLPQVPFFPYVFLKDVALWLVALGILVTLSTLFPPEIGKKADMLAAPPENIKPEWYFLFVFQTLKLFPGEIMGLNGEVIAVLLVSLAVLFLFLVPYLDKKSADGKRSPFFTAISVLYLGYFLVMTMVGFFS